MQCYLSSNNLKHLMSQATASNHSNIFISTPVLSGGRTGGAWEPSHKMMLFLPPPPGYNVSYFSHDF
jgi:hypothetical protein